MVSYNFIFNFILNDFLWIICVFFQGKQETKLTVQSIIEASFTLADRNNDSQIDIPEFVYFSVNSLPSNLALKNMNESLKVMKLFDENNDDKLSIRGNLK